MTSVVKQSALIMGVLIDQKSRNKARRARRRRSPHKNGKKAKSIVKTRLYTSKTEMPSKSLIRPGTGLGQIALFMNGSLALATFVLGLLQTHAVAAPMERIDQRQIGIDLTTGTLAIGGGSDQKLAQVVTAGTSGLLTAVGIPLAGNGTLDLEIQGVTAHQPNGNILAAQSFDGSAFPDFFTDPQGFRRLELAQPIFFSAGTSFAFVLSAPGAQQGDSFGVLQGPVGDSYSGGDAFFDARPNAMGVWAPFSDFGRDDLPFETFVQTVPDRLPAWSVNTLLVSLLSIFQKRRSSSALYPLWVIRGALG